MGEFDDYDIYKMIVNSKGNDNKLFELICKNGSKGKLDSCGGGVDALLEPGNWRDGEGKSYTVDDDDDDDDDSDVDDDDSDIDDEL